MSVPTRLDELPVPLPAEWEAGRAQCQEQVAAWQPPRADLNTLAQWVAQGLAKITGMGPEPPTQQQPFFIVNYEVIGFDTLKEPKWCLDTTYGFPCQNYDECEVMLAEAGFRKQHVTDENGIERVLYTVQAS